MNKRHSYHTTLKELVYHKLLPEQYLKSIPKTNIHRWRNDYYNRYIGSDLNNIAEEHAETIRTISEYPKMLEAYSNLVKTLILIGNYSQEFSSTIRENKEKVVDAILLYQELIPITKAVEVFNISKGTFYTWVADVKLKCKKSAFNLCNKIYPTQITALEVKAIKDALTDRKTLHWSIKSVYLKGINDGSITVSENTMYKVNKLLGIRNSHNRKKKKRHKTGIRAKKPNQIWHADITVFKTLDGKKHYIYLVLDNFSRYILSYRVADKVCGTIRTQTIQEAYKHTLSQNRNEELNIDLIVDGGSENCNVYVNDFINNSEINMRRLIALKDIEKSNSMIERVNNTLKYSYLFLREIRDRKHLIRSMNYFFKDYNTIRPHGKLKGLTPFKSWLGEKIDNKYRIKLLKKAKKERLAYNKTNQCEKCKR